MNLNEYDRSTDAPDVAASIDTTLESIQDSVDRHERVSAAVQHDFETNALTPVLGWWFPTTEIRQCLITFLLETE